MTQPCTSKNPTAEIDPIADVMKSELLAGSYIQADETPVGVQMHDKRGKNHQSYLWQYGSPGKGVVFDFRMGREGEGPKQTHLRRFDPVSGHHHHYTPLIIPITELVLRTAA